MRANEVIFAALVTVGLAVAIGLELNTAFWASWVIPFFGIFSFMGLLALGGVLHVSGRVMSRATVGYLAILALIWFLPINPIERFVRDVGQLYVGMPAADVETIMAGHVKRARLAGSDGVSVIPDQPIVGKTYYEPHGQHHSFDTCCLVSWQDQRVSDIEVYRD